ncbi:MAG: hypothetical protein MJ239_02040 [Bacilli bacterium]|nr:hypothetical protein [Bacilli bacterium]
MNKQEENSQFYPVGPVKAFFSSLINALLVCLLSVGFYFSIFQTIKYTSMKGDVDRKENSYSLILKEGRESGLLKGNESNTMVFSCSNYYEFFVAELLKHDYLSPYYDYEKDPDGFKKAESKFKDIPQIEIDGNQIKDDYLGHFYTSYVIGRVDEGGNKLVTYSQEDSVSSYINGILSANDPSKGGAFFDYIDDSTFPILKSNVRTLLFGYVINSIVTDATKNMDQKFYSYFQGVFDGAQDLLMKDSVYGAAYRNFEESNSKLLSFDTIGVFVSFGIASLIAMIVIPLIAKKGRSLGNIITKTQYVQENDSFETKNLLLLFLISIPKYIFVIGIFVLISNQQILLSPWFHVFGKGVNGLFLLAASLIVDAASIIITLVHPDNRNLDGIVSMTTLCSKPRHSETNKPSGTVSE